MIVGGAAGLVRRWVRVYTRGVPADLRDRRREEIDADLWSQLEEAAFTRRPAPSTNAEIVTRWLAGIPADLSWRLEHRGGTPVATQPATASAPMSPWLGGLAIAGGLGLYSLMYRYSEATANDAFYWLGVLGELAIAAVLGALVAIFHDRFWTAAAVLGSVGAIGMLLAGIGLWWLMLVVPVCGAVLVWNLGMLRIVARWVAALHVVAAVGLLGIGVAYFSGTTVSALFVALAVYPATWVLIGLSLLRQNTLPVPAPAT